MTKAAYNRLSDDEKAKHDAYMVKYYAGKFYKGMEAKFQPQVNKMDKWQLTYALCNGAYHCGVDHFAWKKLKELGPEKSQLDHVKRYGMYYNQDIYEEVLGILQEV